MAPTTSSCRKNRIGQVHPGGAVADEVGIGEVLQVLPRGQALHRRIQFLRSGLEQGPEQEQDEAQKAGTGYRQQVDGEADGDVGQQTGRLAQSMPEQPPEEREKTGNCRNEKENFVVHWISPRLKANWRVKSIHYNHIMKEKRYRRRIQAVAGHRGGRPRYFLILSAIL